MRTSIFKCNVTGEVAEVEGEDELPEGWVYIQATRFRENPAHVAAHEAHETQVRMVTQQVQEMAGTEEQAAQIRESAIGQLDANLLTVLANIPAMVEESIEGHLSPRGAGLLQGSLGLPDWEFDFEEVSGEEVSGEEGEGEEGGDEGGEG